MSRGLLTFAVAFILCSALGCNPSPTSGRGFSLPEGDAQRGRETFVRLQCHACHTVAGTEFEPIEASEQTMIHLGGPKAIVVTHGQLVTSIINPSHRFADGYDDADIKQNDTSKMRLYNDVMTVTELTDLVTFLQEHYVLEPYRPTPYRPYY